jgi:hypothetical protein
MLLGILFLNETYIFIVQNLTIKIITQTEPEKCITDLDPYR